MAVSSLENISLDDDESLKEKTRMMYLFWILLYLQALLPMLLQHPWLKPQDLTPEFNEHDLLFTFSAKWAYFMI